MNYHRVGRGTSSRRPAVFTLVAASLLTAIACGAGHDPTDPSWDGEAGSEPTAQVEQAVAACRSSSGSANCPSGEYVLAKGCFANCADFSTCSTLGGSNWVDCRPVTNDFWACEYCPAGYMVTEQSALNDTNCNRNPLRTERSLHCVPVPENPDPEPEPEPEPNPNECKGEGGGNNCHTHATCQNTNSGFTCKCKPGYRGNGVTCTDYNECAGENGGDNCGLLYRCVNLSGSFRCDHCPVNHYGSGSVCIDYNECAGENWGNRCASGATCTNTPGSYTCACPSNRFGDGFVCFDTQRAWYEYDCNRAEETCFSSCRSRGATNCNSACGNIYEMCIRNR